MTIDAELKKMAAEAEKKQNDRFRAARAHYIRLGAELKLSGFEPMQGLNTKNTPKYYISAQIDQNKKAPKWWQSWIEGEKATICSTSDSKWLLVKIPQGYEKEVKKAYDAQTLTV